MPARFLPHGGAPTLLHVTRTTSRPVAVACVRNLALPSIIDTECTYWRIMQSRADGTDRRSQPYPPREPPLRVAIFRVKLPKAGFTLSVQDSTYFAIVLTARIILFSLLTGCYLTRIKFSWLMRSPSGTYSTFHQNILGLLHRSIHRICHILIPLLLKGIYYIM